MIIELLSLLVGIVVILAIIAANGYFVAQEFAYMSVDRVKLSVQAESGDASAARALSVTRRTSFMLSGAQLGITITGLLVGFVIRLLYTGGWEPGGESEGLRNFARILRSPAALLLAAGYCAAIVVAFQKPWGRRLFGLFAPVGRMALTNYLAQGLIYAFILYGAPLGLGLAGKIGTFFVLLICIVFFAFQTVFSHWWLARFRFGPMEWLWRALTYGERPAMRRPSGAAVPA